MQIKQIRNVKILSLITVLLVLILGVLSIFNVSGLKKNFSNSFRTMAVLQASSDLYSALLSTESNMRGFMITKNSVYERAFHESKNDLNRKLDSLRTFTRNNPEQIENIDSLSKLLDIRLEIFNSNYQNTTKVDTLGAEIIQGVQRSLEISEKIRAIINRINEVENRLLQQRTAGLNKGIKTLPGFLLFIALISFGTAGLAFYSVRQYSLSQKISQNQIRAYQEQLKEQIQRLNFSNEELAQFAFIASHDLQEPLRKINSFSELLNTNFKDKLGSDGELYLERIDSSVKRMRNLIIGLLNFSRVARDRIDEKIELNTILNTVKDDLEIIIKEKNANVQVSNLPNVKGSSSEYLQLFQNLISNALKFSRPGIDPIIKISSHSTTEEEIKRLTNRIPGQDYQSIVVSDNGIGFEKEYADKIFVIFQRLHGRDQYDGTGIGLAICKKIVEKNGGVIYAESVLDQGSKFTIIIPTITVQARE